MLDPFRSVYHDDQARMDWHQLSPVYRIIIVAYLSPEKE